MRGAGRINPGARAGTPNRRFPQYGRQPTISTPRLRQVVSPVQNVPRPLSAVESYRWKIDLKPFVTSLRLVTRPQDMRGALTGIAAQLKSTLMAMLASSDERGPECPWRFVSEHDAHVALLGLQEYLVEAYSEAEDDPFGQIKALGKRVHAAELLHETVAFLGLMAVLASHPELGFPHPADLKAVIVEKSFANWALGPNRSPSRLSTISAPLGDGEKLAMRRWQRSAGPHPELLVQPDVRSLMVALGWDGHDQRCVSR